MYATADWKTTEINVYGDVGTKMVWDLMLILRGRGGVNVHACLRRAIFGKQQTWMYTKSLFWVAERMIVVVATKSQLSGSLQVNYKLVEFIDDCCH